MAGEKYPFLPGRKPTLANDFPIKRVNTKFILITAGIFVLNMKTDFN